MRNFEANYTGTVVPDDLPHLREWAEDFRERLDQSITQAAEIETDADLQAFVAVAQGLAHDLSMHQKDIEAALSQRTTQASAP